jgi:CBS domain containing-hemolysin-like protein
MGLGAFLIAVPIGLLSETTLTKLNSLIASFLVLCFIIIVGIICDIIGVAVTAAQEAPLHARAAAGVYGARKAADLVRNAHQVASFCNDVIGDVSGTISGALGVAIIYQLFRQPKPVVAIVATALMSATIAGLIVGGKAFGKVYAIRRSTEIVFLVGKFLTFIQRLPGKFIPF